ncbi:16S rRNA (adenine(1518)-N(6)/adenine(1519)-N(6))-dimethyltransferase, partial [bacterium (Candidatus Gribaldobacteria) CG_4_10_14_0_8_um_filter_33_9]
MLKQDIQKLLKEKGIWPKKGLGQNFLISQKILEKIVIASLLKPQDIVLEIGPGLGILTKELASRVKKVIAIEKDAKLAGILQEILIKSGIKNVEVVQGDILTKSKIQIPKNYKIVSN